MMRKNKLSLLALPVLFLSQPVLASGTSGGSFGGGFGGNGFDLPSASRDPEAEAYARGKSMVSKRIACKKCAYPTGVKDTPTAQEVANRVRAGEFGLEPDERVQVLHYLSRRFRG